MSIAACPHCGSKNIRLGTIWDSVFTVFSLDVCRDCGYRGLPIVFDSEGDYARFLGEIPRIKRATEKHGSEQKNSGAHGPKR